MNLTPFSSTMGEQQSKHRLLAIEKQYIDLLNLLHTKLKVDKETAFRNWLSAIKILEKLHQDLYQKLDSTDQDIRIMDIIKDWGNTLEAPYTNYLKSYSILQNQHESLLCASIKPIIKQLPTTSPFNSIDTLLAAPFDQLKLYKSIFSPLLDSSDSSKQNTLKQIIQTIDTILRQSPQRMVNSATATDLVSFQKYVDCENVIDLFTGSHLDYQLRSRPGKIVLQDEFLLMADNNDQPAQRIHMVLTTDILMVCKQRDEPTGRYDLLYPPLAVNDILVQPLLLDRELIGEYTLQFTVLSKNLTVRAESREVRNAWTGVPLTTTAKNANKSSIPLMNVVRLSENSLSNKNGVNNSSTKSANGALYNTTDLSGDDDDDNDDSDLQHSLVDKKSLPTVPAHSQSSKKGNIIAPPKDYAAPVINIGLHEDTKQHNLMQPVSKDHHTVRQRGSSMRPPSSNPAYNPVIESKPLPESSSSRNRNTGSPSPNARSHMNTPPQPSNRNTQLLPHQQHPHSRQSTSLSPSRHHQHRSSSHGAGNTQPHQSSNGHGGSRSTMSSQPRPNASHHYPPSQHHQSQQRPPSSHHHSSQARASQYYQPHQRPAQHHQPNQRPPSHHRVSHHPQSQQRPSAQNHHSQQRHPQQQRPPQHYQPQYRPPPPTQQQQRPSPHNHHQQQPRTRPPQPPASVPANTSKPLPQNFNATPAVAAVVSPSSPSTSSQRTMPPTPPPQKPQFNAAPANPESGSQLRSPPMAASQESFGSSLRLSPEDLATPPRSPNPYNNQTNGIRQVIFRNEQCEVFRWNDESWYAVDGQCLLEVRQTFTNRSCIAIRVQTTGELYLNAWVLPQTQIRLASPTDVSLGLVMGAQQETYLVHFENAADATELNQVLQKMHHAAVVADRQQPNDGQRTLRGDPPTEMMMDDDDDDDDIEGTTLTAVNTTGADGTTTTAGTVARSSSLMQSGQEPTPIPQTLQPAMQCKCKLFVQNEHSNWSSFGSVQLVVSLQVPSRRMHIQIDHDKKRGFSKIIPSGGGISSSPSSTAPTSTTDNNNSSTLGNTVVTGTSENTLVSATVYSNNVERLGAKRISFLLVNERERTSSMVYMVQLREEESGNTLYDYLKIKNAQNGW